MYNVYTQARARSINPTAFKHVPIYHNVAVSRQERPLAANVTYLANYTDVNGILARQNTLLLRLLGFLRRNLGQLVELFSSDLAHVPE